MADSKIVEGSVRHIYCKDIKSDKGTSGDKGIKNNKGCLATKPTILENKKTSCIPTGSKKFAQKFGKSLINVKAASFGDEEPGCSDSVAAAYGQPKFHSTLRLAQALHKAQNEDLNLTLRVDEKCQSPNTAHRVKKQVAKKVTFHPSQQIFKGLFSADVSENNLIQQLEDQLSLRAEALKPKEKEQIRKPQFIDYLNLQEYVSTFQIEKANVTLPCSSLRPTKVSRENIIYFPHEKVDLNVTGHMD